MDPRALVDRPARDDDAVSGGRGRRDNGLPATSWSPLRDVDPRVGEHLLDVLEAAGIAAYLDPSSDVGPYTREVSLPSPPSDRLFVDRSRQSDARALVERYGDEHAEHRRRPTDPAPVRADLDEDAEWSRIVAAYEAEHGTPAAGDEQPSDAPPPAPHEVSVLDLPDEHYEPPPPPPVPVPAPHALYAGLLVALGLLLIATPGSLRLSADLGLALGVAAIAGGAAMLVSRMRDRSDDDGDDGAVV